MVPNLQGLSVYTVHRKSVLNTLCLLSKYFHMHDLTLGELTLARTCTTSIIHVCSLTKLRVLQTVTRVVMCNLRIDACMGDCACACEVQFTAACTGCGQRSKVPNQPSKVSKPPNTAKLCPSLTS